MSGSPVAAGHRVHRLRHGRLTVALHELRSPVPPGPARQNDHPLLLLHALGSKSPDAVPFDVVGWNGPIYALDFTGHGESDVPRGGGYTAEALMGDVDAALLHLGSATVLGRGLGGYLALLIAGARPTLVRGAIIEDGVGLTGGATTAQSVHLEFPNRAISPTGKPDPYALMELATDVRPPDYVLWYAQAAVQGRPRPPGIAVVAAARPLWLLAVLDQFGVEAMSLSEALAVFGAE